MDPELPIQDDLRELTAEEIAAAREAMNRRAERVEWRLNRNLPVAPSPSQRPEDKPEDHAVAQDCESD